MTTTESTTSSPIVLGPSEGSHLNLFGQDMLVRIPRESTGNRLWLGEYTIDGNYGGPPPHFHRRTHEIFYVLEGELGMLVEDKEIAVKPGGLAMVGPYTRHTFYNKSGDPCRFIGITTPGDLGGYLEALPKVIAEHGFPPPADLNAALAEQFDGGIFSTAP
ncbi:MAG TPA: cupin domain-containing protein [Dehalococcoidia bacterium]|jgi:mannose-6-phosphate isomerase-like protein (cupin superfamily)|nr:cupin domain-containing protein [Dehalococcoidia bacterium]